MTTLGWAPALAIHWKTVPLDYVAKMVIPPVPDAWIDHDKTKVGYEISFTRRFYVCTTPRPPAEIDAELRELEERIQKLLGR